MKRHEQALWREQSETWMYSLQWNQMKMRALGQPENRHERSECDVSEVNIISVLYSRVRPKPAHRERSPTWESTKFSENGQERSDPRVAAYSTLKKHVSERGLHVAIFLKKYKTNSYFYIKKNSLPFARKIKLFF